MATVEYEKKDHLAVITLNRPERLNAFDEDMLRALRDTWIRFRDDDDAWIAILTGTGRAFSSGADKSWFDKALSGSSSPETFFNRIAQDPYWSGQIDKPVIAAVNGFAVGAGLDLVLRSDFRVAAEGAWLQQPEAALGTLVLFHDSVPYAVAAEMVAGFRIHARRAYEVGLINRLAPDDKLMDVALEMAGELLTKAPLALCNALRILKELKKSAVSVPYRLVDHYAAVLSKNLMNTEDFKEAASALVNKTKPVFKRR